MGSLGIPVIVVNTAELLYDSTTACCACVVDHSCDAPAAEGAADSSQAQQTPCAENLLRHPWASDI